jgi:hypothetical protein
MEEITQRQLEWAAVEAEGLELEHGSDLSRVLGRDGIQFDDLLNVARAFASMTTTHRFDNDPTGMSERDLRLTHEATLAAFVRGFAAAPTAAPSRRFLVALDRTPRLLRLTNMA